MNYFILYCCSIKACFLIKFKKKTNDIEILLKKSRIIKILNSIGIRE
jgi:hypothetical protein